VISKRIEQIDILRGLAAMWVMLSHYQPYWSRAFSPTTIIVPNSFGIHAVELFFVISGFVIFMTLDRCKTVVDFAVMRFSRLYPAYWSALAISTIASIALLGGSLWPGGLLANATMLQQFLGFPHNDIVYWSLTVEMAFYLNVAWVFALGLHRNPKRVLIVWLLASAAWAVIHPRPDGPFLGTDPRQWPALFFALDFAPYFSIGIVFFDAMKWGWSERRFGILALAVVTQWLIAGWVGVLITLIIIGIFWMAVSGRLSLLVSKTTLFLGAISYPLYLCHRGMGYSAMNWMHAKQMDASIAIPIVMVGAISLAAFITFVIEKPGVRLIRRWYDAHGAGHHGHLQPAAVPPPARS
jgi:peptidoglycan/LPS O-acetylase OafA/YrhL